MGGQGVGRGKRSFSALRFAHQPGSSLNPTFCKFLWLFHYVGVTEDRTGHWRYLVPSPSHCCPRGVRLTAPTSNQVLVFLMTCPLLKLSGGLPRVDKLSHFIKRWPITGNTQEPPRVLGAVCQELRTKTK